MRKPWPTWGCRAKNKNNQMRSTDGDVAAAIKTDCPPNTFGVSTY